MNDLKLGPMDNSLPMYTEVDPALYVYNDATHTTALVANAATARTVRHLISADAAYIHLVQNRCLSAMRREKNPPQKLEKGFAYYRALKIYEIAAIERHAVLEKPQLSNSINKPSACLCTTRICSLNTELTTVWLIQTSWEFGIWKCWLNNKQFQMRWTLPQYVGSLFILVL
ncbi:unnamed protein product [Ambrosiozyma monospora]|uniref:Unnamed protein product n=1 Tax=Ambrosiozyma monospora TaxID=43982 RepID=A0ACB5SU88_AMBMO|nr:unnamed protein product [Ambrosiozyma monospora]